MFNVSNTELAEWRRKGFKKRKKREGQSLGKRLKRDVIRATTPNSPLGKKKTELKLVLKCDWRRSKHCSFLLTRGEKNGKGDSHEIGRG